MLTVIRNIRRLLVRLLGFRHIRGARRAKVHDALTVVEKMEARITRPVKEEDDPPDKGE